MPKTFAEWLTDFVDDEKAGTESKKLKERLRNTVKTDEDAGALNQVLDHLEERFKKAGGK